MAATVSRLAASISNAVRLARARHKHKTVRFKVADLPQFYAKLNDADIPYVVLRWLDEVPLGPAEPSAFEHDIDHLIGRGVIDQIKGFANATPGPAKCDFYSINGERGSAYRGMPYLPPALADDVLSNRILRDDGLYAPDATRHFLAFAFHLVYHKGVECGVATGFDQVETDPNPKRDYGTEAHRLATACGISLPQPLTLLGLHETLIAQRWNMPLDLMVRWPHKHAVLKALTTYEQSKLQPLLEPCADLNIFVLRSDCVGDDCIALAHKMIAARFEILENVTLDTHQVEALTRLTRGGSWFEKTQNAPILPTHMFVCRQSAKPGPLPRGMTPEKLAKRYPHLSHTDVLIKRDIRDAVNAALGGPATRIVIHATDNALEAAETLTALKAGDALDYVKALQRS